MSQNDPMRSGSAQVLKWIYLGTPVFLVLDLAFGWDIRVSFFDTHPGWKYGYYIFCFVIGFLMMKQPRLEPILGIIESGANILILSLSILVPYYAAIEAISSGEEFANPFNKYNFINYIFSGLIIMISMHVNQRKLSHNR